MQNGGKLPAGVWRPGPAGGKCAHYSGDRSSNKATSDPRMVKLAELWERTSAKGTRYFSGYMGDAQVLLFDGGERDHPTRPGERVHVWRLMVQERDPSRRPRS